MLNSQSTLPKDIHAAHAIVITLANKFLTHAGIMQVNLL